MYTEDMTSRLAWAWWVLGVGVGVVGGAGGACVVGGAEGAGVVGGAGIVWGVAVASEIVPGSLLEVDGTGTRPCPYLAAVAVVGYALVAYDRQVEHSLPQSSAGWGLGGSPPWVAAGSFPWGVAGSCEALHRWGQG